MKLNGFDQAIAPVEITSLSTEELRLAIQRSVQEEMCMTVEDFLSRRTRQLLLNAREAINAAPLIARLMAEEMNKDENWIKEQINIFNAIANNYAPTLNFKHQTSN